MKLQHSSSSSDNFSSSLLLYPADWKFENIWHDTDMICWFLIIIASHWPDTHSTGLLLAANNWACLWESRSFQTEPSLPYSPPLHWPLLQRTGGGTSSVITFGQTFIMCQHCAMRGWAGEVTQCHQHVCILHTLGDELQLSSLIFNWKLYCYEFN